jgi:hypothetical protein
MDREQLVEEIEGGGELTAAEPEPEILAPQSGHFGQVDRSRRRRPRAEAGAYACALAQEPLGVCQAGNSPPTGRSKLRLTPISLR